MCNSKPKPPAPAPIPVNTSQNIGDQTAPELLKANEQELDIKKKKKKKSGTSSLNTSSGLNIASSGTSYNP